MKRRTIVIGSLTAGGTQVAAAGHLYGVPGSVSARTAVDRLSHQRIFVSLAKLPLPREAVEPASRLMEVFFELTSSEAARLEFHRFPVEFLLSRGVAFPAGQAVAGSVEVAVLKGLLSERARRALRHGTLEDYLQALEAEGVVSESRSISELSRSISDALLINYEKVRVPVEQLIGAEGFLPETTPSEHLHVIRSLFDSAEINPQCSVAAAVCAAYLVVGGVSYVAVIQAVVAATVVVTRLGVFGMEPRLPGDDGAFRPGRLLRKLAPDEVKRYEVAVRIARMQGHHDQANALTANLFGEEVRLILNAIERSGRFNLTRQRRDQIEKSLYGLIAATAAGA